MRTFIFGILLFLSLAMLGQTTTAVFACVHVWLTTGDLFVILPLVFFSLILRGYFIAYWMIEKEFERVV